MVYYAHHKERAMKHLIVALFTSAALVVSAADEATVASTTDVTITANATLKDGSALLFPCREDEMPGYGRRAFTIDDFKVWNYAKTYFPIANH